MKEPVRILVVDDEPDMALMLKRLLSREEGREVSAVFSPLEALEHIKKWDPHVVVADVKMPEMDGLELLAAIRQLDPTISVIIITGYGTINMAVRALKEGAYDFIEKPFDNDRMRHTVRRAVERTLLMRENNRLQKMAGQNGETFYGMVGSSLAMKREFELIARVADTDVTVLIRGESGTGKELVARAIHLLSSRRHKEMITVNCPALPEHILESELFGYVKGAFTGATRDKEGLFVTAHGSTILLDEIADIPVSIQTKLLRVLQEGEVRPLGSTKSIPVDVRVIASTNQNLEEKIAKGEFREDLFYRLNIVTINLPPLRERKEDIPLLAMHFLKKYTKRYHREGLKLSPEALECLLARDWPGNVRELENTIRRAVLLATEEEIKPHDVLPEPTDVPPCIKRLEEDLLDKPYREAKEALLERFSKRYLENVLTKTQGNVTRAAQISGLERQALQRLMRRYGIKSQIFRS